MAEIEYYEKEKDATAVSAEGSVAEMAAEDNKEMYVPGLVLGIISIVIGLLVPLFGWILSIIGFILALCHKKENKVLVPIILNVAGFIASTGVFIVRMSKFLDMIS